MRKPTALIILLLASEAAKAQPAEPADPPHGAPRGAVPASPALTWFGVEVSPDGGAAIHLQLSIDVRPSLRVEGDFLIASLKSIGFDARQNWGTVDLQPFNIPLVSIAPYNVGGTVEIRLGFKPGLAPAARPEIRYASDGFYYVTLRIAPASAAVTEPPPVQVPAEQFPSTTTTSGESRLARKRRGFTLDLSIGPSASILFVSDESDFNGGFSGINLALGGWISPRTSLSGRFTSNSIFPKSEDGRTQIILQSATLSLKRFLNDNVHVTGGLGAATVYVDFEQADETGFAIDVRIGKDWKPTESGSWFVEFGLTPINFSDGWIVSIAGVLGWRLD